MKFGSICSGVEAASVAWNHLGWSAAWLAEVDPAASAVLAYRLDATAPQFPLPGTEKALKRIAWGDRITNWGDMTRLPEMVRSGAADAPDILCGGTPCQGFSVAGLRGGLSDPRGQLTLSFVELANAIDDKRAQRGDCPCVIFWENVPGVRTIEGNAFGHFLAGLVGAEDAVEPGPRPEPGRSSTHWAWKKETREHVPRWPSAGAVVGPRRTVAWRSNDAQHFGLAQRRERLFVVGSAREGFDPQAVLFEFDGVRRDSAPSREAGESVTHSLAPCLTSSGRGIERAGDTRGQDAVVAVYRGSERPAELAGYRMTAFGEYADDDTASTIKARDYKDATDLVVLPFDTTQMTSPSNYSKPKYGDPCHPLAAGAHPPAVCVTGDITHTLTADGFDASEDGTGRGQPIVVHGTQDPCSAVDLAFALGRNSGGENGVLTGIAVRRLMPVETERLQGFPDDWSQVPVGKGLAADGPRYKQMGNSWAVNCVAWIGERLAAHLRSLETPRQPVAMNDNALHLWLLSA